MFLIYKVEHMLIWIHFYRLDPNILIYTIFVSVFQSTTGSVVMFNARSVQFYVQTFLQPPRNNQYLPFGDVSSFFLQS